MKRYRFAFVFALLFSLSSCTFITGFVFLQCGDGLYDPERGESCDDGNQTAGDGCSLDCTLELILANSCDNGVIDAGEICYELELKTVGLDPRAVSIVDIDGDADLDILVVNRG